MHGLETATATAAAASAAARTTGLAPEIAEQAAVWLPLLLRTLAAPPAPPAQVRALDLTLDVFGGGTEVGGSCVLVTAARTRLLVDAGSRPGGTNAASLAPSGIARPPPRR